MKISFSAKTDPARTSARWPFPAPGPTLGLGLPLTPLALAALMAGACPAPIAAQEGFGATDPGQIPHRYPTVPEIIERMGKRGVVRVRRRTRELHLSSRPSQRSTPSTTTPVSLDGEYMQVTETSPSTAVEGTREEHVRLFAPQEHP